MRSSIRSKEYVNGGGTVIVCGLADYQDGNDPGENNEYTTYGQINKLLEGIGASVRVNDDELLDQDENGASRTGSTSTTSTLKAPTQPSRPRFAGLEGSGKTYSSYSAAPSPSATAPR